MRYDQKKILITGASSGIGAEFAKQFHALGADLIISARRKDVLDSLAVGFNAARPSSCAVLCVDLTKATDIDTAAHYIKNHQIDILINNAGRGSFGHFEEIPVNEERDMVRLNIEATLTLAHAVIPQMKQRRNGAIISISSISAFQPLPYMATYAATKSFNYMHSMAIRAELASFGVKVLTVCPGPTDTEFGGVARVPGTYSDLGTDNVALVVKQSLSALERNNSFVVTGLRSWVMSLASRILPRAITIPLTEKAMLDILHKK